MSSGYVTSATAPVTRPACDVTIVTRGISISEWITALPALPTQCDEILQRFVPLVEGDEVCPQVVPAAGGRQHLACHHHRPEAGRHVLDCFVGGGEARL